MYFSRWCENPIFLGPGASQSSIISGVDPNSILPLHEQSLKPSSSLSGSSTWESLLRLKEGSLGYGSALL